MVYKKRVLVLTDMTNDVDIEVHLLSRTDYLFCCSVSNVNLLTRTISPYLSIEEL